MTIPLSNQSTCPLEYHFRGARSAMKPLVEDILAKLEAELPDFELKVGKAYIGLLHNLVFAALHVQAKKVIVEFTSRKEVSSQRIVKSKQFQKSRWAYYVEATTPASFDAQLLRWVKGSYE
jgi:predicted patatin/cPLA2 family phospholipase